MSVTQITEQVTSVAKLFVVGALPRMREGMMLKGPNGSLI